MHVNKTNRGKNISCRVTHTDIVPNCKQNNLCVVMNSIPLTIKSTSNASQVRVYVGFDRVSADSEVIIIREWSVRL